MKKSSKTAKVSLEFQKENPAELCTTADGIVTGLTGNAFITTFPVALAIISTQIGAVRADLQKIASGDLSKTLTKLLAHDATALMISLTSNGHSVQDQANTIAAGDYAKAQQIILSTGYKLARATTHKPRDFEVVYCQPNIVHVHTKKTKTGTEGSLWRYGITTAKNIPPTVLITRFTVETDLIITDLPSGCIVGIQHASVVPVSHTIKTSATITAVGKAASAIPLSKSRHPVISHLTVDPYQWTSFIYTGVL